MTTARELRLTVPASAENVMVVRQAVAGLGEALGLSGERIADLKTVVTEACNNVVLHAYDDEPVVGTPSPVTASSRSRSPMRDTGFARARARAIRRSASACR